MLSTCSHDYLRHGGLATASARSVARGPTSIRILGGGELVLEAASLQLVLHTGANQSDVSINLMPPPIVIEEIHEV